MDHSTALQLQQEMSSNSLENMLVCTKSQQEKKPKPQPEQPLNCPRCDSTNTKFCYYNNYSLSQPRYFCKSCRRYWTKGGTLRNVPVGGGCRKNKRSSSSFSSSSKRTQDHHHHQSNITTSPNPNNPLSDFSPLTTYDSNDLTLAFARLQKHSTNEQLGFDDPQDQLSILGNHHNNSHFDAIINPTIIPTSATTNLGFLDSLRSNFLESSGTNFNTNFYYGFGNNNIIPNINADDVAAHCGESTGQMMLPYGEEMRVHCAEKTPTTTSAVTVTTMKQEVCNGTNKEDGSSVLWGFPCQINGDGNMGQVVDNSGRESWSGFAAPSWHGLFNSPLM